MGVGADNMVTGLIPMSALGSWSQFELAHHIYFQAMGNI